jgi:hypothetical protein
VRHRREVGPPDIDEVWVESMMHARRGVMFAPLRKPLAACQTATNSSP